MIIQCVLSTEKVQRLTVSTKQRRYFQRVAMIRHLYKYPSFIFYLGYLSFNIVKNIYHTFYKRMSSIKRQVKHLTKKALDPSRCFSIILDQVRTISFRLRILTRRARLHKTFLQTKQKNRSLDLECPNNETRDHWYHQVFKLTKH